MYKSTKRATLGLVSASSVGHIESNADVILQIPLAATQEEGFWECYKNLSPSWQERLQKCDNQLRSFFVLSKFVKNQLSLQSRILQRAKKSKNGNHSPTAAWPCRRWGFLPNEFRCFWDCSSNRVKSANLQWSWCDTLWPQLRCSYLVLIKSSTKNQVPNCQRPQRALCLCMLTCPISLILESYCESMSEYMAR